MFQKTYVSITSNPPSLDFCIRSGHICQHKKKNINHNYSLHTSLFLGLKTGGKRNGKKKIEAYVRGAARIMNGTRDQNAAFPVDDNRSVVVRDGGCERRRYYCTQPKEQHQNLCSRPHFGNLQSYNQIPNQRKPL